MKLYLGVGAVIIVLLFVALWVASNKKMVKSNKSSVKPTEAMLEKVDSSVVVTLESDSLKRDATLKIDKIPSGTTSIDYELSYNTQSQGLQGVIGTITQITNQSAQKKLTLGTCSSGTCVYHQVVGSIQLSLKFGGDYGQKAFEKEFQL